MPRETLDTKLTQLKNEIYLLGSMVEQAVLDSVDTLRTRDLKEAKRIYDEDNIINEKRYALENAIIILLATQQPFARDLRLLAAMLLVVNELERMADYAKLVQDKGMVPIVEPEVLYDGNHTNARCEEVTTKVLKKLFDILKEKDVNLTNLILKSNMVLPGKDSGVTMMPLEVSNSTLRTLQNSVPNDVPLIVFLSGGQTSEQAIFNLNEIVKLNIEKKFGGWDLTFSFERALQEGVLDVWCGKEENVSKAQEVFSNRLQKVSKARIGEL